MLPLVVLCLPTCLSLPSAPSICSISYALQNLGTRLVLVLGHTKCGAVKAAVAEFVDRAKARHAEASW